MWDRPLEAKYVLIGRHYKSKSEKEIPKIHTKSLPMSDAMYVVD